MPSRGEPSAESGRSCFLAVLAVLVIVGLASCRSASPGDTRAEVSSSLTPGAPGSTPIAASSSWAAEGSRLKQFKSDRNSQAGTSSLPGNSGPWAYESKPVDITGPGNYVFDFGPIDPQYESAVTSVASFDWPSDMQFRLSPLSAPEIKQINGGSYFEVTFGVTQFISAYPSMTGWIY